MVIGTEVTDDDVRAYAEAHGVPLDGPDGGVNGRSFCVQNVLLDRGAPVNAVRRGVERVRSLDYVVGNGTRALYFPWGDAARYDFFESLLRDDGSAAGRERNLIERAKFYGATNVVDLSDAAGVLASGWIVRAVPDASFAYTVGNYYTNGLPEVLVAYDAAELDVRSVGRIANGCVRALLDGFPATGSGISGEDPHPSPAAPTADADACAACLSGCVRGLLRPSSIAGDDDDAPVPVPVRLLSERDHRSDYPIGYSLLFYVNFMDADPTRDVPHVLVDLRRAKKGKMPSGDFLVDGKSE